MQTGLKSSLRITQLEPYRDCTCLAAAFWPRPRISYLLGGKTCQSVHNSETTVACDILKLKSVLRLPHTLNADMMKDRRIAATQYSTSNMCHPIVVNTLGARSLTWLLKAVSVWYLPVCLHLFLLSVWVLEVCVCVSSLRPTFHLTAFAHMLFNLAWCCPERGNKWFRKQSISHPRLRLTHNSLSLSFLKFFQHCWTSRL